jgi:hypothetical protein
VTKGRTPTNKEGNDLLRYSILWHRREASSIVDLAQLVANRSRVGLVLLSSLHTKQNKDRIRSRWTSRKKGGMERGRKEGREHTYLPQELQGTIFCELPKLVFVVGSRLHERLLLVQVLLWLVRGDVESQQRGVVGCTWALPILSRRMPNKLAPTPIKCDEKSTLIEGHARKEGHTSRTMSFHGMSPSLWFSNKDSTSTCVATRQGYFVIMAAEPTTTQDTKREVCKKRGEMGDKQTLERCW